MTPSPNPHRNKRPDDTQYRRHQPRHKRRLIQAAVLIISSRRRHNLTRTQLTGPKTRNSCPRCGGLVHASIPEIALRNVHRLFCRNLAAILHTLAETLKPVFQPKWGLPGDLVEAILERALGKALEEYVRDYRHM